MAPKTRKWEKSLGNSVRSNLARPEMVDKLIGSSLDGFKAVSMTPYSPRQIRVLALVDSLEFPAKQVDELIRLKLQKRDLIELRDPECAYLSDLIRCVRPKRLDGPLT